MKIDFHHSLAGPAILRGERRVEANDPNTTFVPHRGGAISLVMIDQETQRFTRVALEEILFRETTTLGLRKQEIDRLVLPREIVTVSLAEAPHLLAALGVLPVEASNVSATVSSARAARPTRPWRRDRSRRRRRCRGSSSERCMRWAPSTK